MDGRVFAVTALAILFASCGDSTVGPNGVQVTIDPSRVEVEASRMTSGRSSSRRPRSCPRRAAVAVPMRKVAVGKPGSRLTSAAPSASRAEARSSSTSVSLAPTGSRENAPLPFHLSSAVMVITSSSGCWPSITTSAVMSLVMEAMGTTCPASCS